MVQVHHDEGVANRIDPESCADTREGIGEALTGERIGQPLSREGTLILGADVVPVTEGNTDGRDRHVRTLFAWEPGDLMVGQRLSNTMDTGFCIAALDEACPSEAAYPQSSPIVQHQKLEPCATTALRVFQ